MVYDGPAADLEECADLCRGTEFVPDLFYGPVFTGNDLSQLTAAMLLEYLDTMKDYSKQESVKMEDVFDAVTFEGKRIPRDAPVDDFKKEAGLYSKFMVTYGRRCRELDIFGDATVLQRDRAKEYDRILARNSAMWDVLVTLRTLEDCQKDDYDPSESNGLGFQTAMYAAEGTKEGNAEMYERLLAFTYRNNFRKSGSIVYQEQKTVFDTWVAHGKCCTARNRLLHAPFDCAGEHVYGICQADAWCLAYAEVVCRIHEDNPGNLLSAGLKLRIDEEYGEKPRRMVPCSSAEEERVCLKAKWIWQMLWRVFDETSQAHVSESADTEDPTEQICSIVSKHVLPLQYKEYREAVLLRDRVSGFPLSEKFGVCRDAYLAALGSYVDAMVLRVRKEDARHDGGVVDLRKVLRLALSELLAVVVAFRELQAFARTALNAAGNTKPFKPPFDDSESFAGGIFSVAQSADVKTNNARLAEKLEFEYSALCASPMWKYIEEACKVLALAFPAAGSSCQQRAKFHDRATEATDVLEDLTIQMRKYACSWWLRMEDERLPEGESDPAKAVCERAGAFGWQLSVATRCAKEYPDASRVRNRVCVTTCDDKAEDKQDSVRAAGCKIGTGVKIASCAKPVWSTSHRPAAGKLERGKPLGSRTWTQRMKYEGSLQAMTIEELVMSIVDPHRVEHTARWRRFVESFSSNLHNAVTYMTKTVDPGFQDHYPDPDLFSFVNGMYNIKTNEFYKYGTVPAGWHSGINYIAQYFDPLLTSMPVDCIRVPGYDDILESQQYNVKDPGGSKQYWMDVFIGRVFFKLDEKDHWQKVLIIKGQGATGKSTIAKAIMRCVGDRNVGIIASNCEAQYALANMQNKTMWMCTEMKAGFRLDMAAMQNMISGDPVTINAKYKDAVDIAAWRLPGLLIGNEIPHAWMCDVGGALLRRTVLFEFGMNPKKQDASIGNVFLANLPAFLARTTRTYIQATKQNNGVLVLPPGMQGFQNSFAKITSPFAQFLSGTTSPYEFSDENRLYSIYHQLFVLGDAKKIEIDVDMLVESALSTEEGGVGAGAPADAAVEREKISLGKCYAMKQQQDGDPAAALSPIEDCGLSRETLRRVCAWRAKQRADSDSIKEILPGQVDGSVSLSEIMTKYRSWKEEKKQARNIPDLDKGTIEAMCKELGILYKDDKLYGLLIDLRE